MEAVVYSNFRNNLKNYMKKVNDEYEPLMVVNKNPDENIVVLSKKNWDSIQETIRLMNNEYLSDKVLSGMEQVKQKKTIQRQLLEVENADLSTFLKLKQYRRPGSNRHVLADTGF